MTGSRFGPSVNSKVIDLFLNFCKRIKEQITQTKPTLAHGDRKGKVLVVKCINQAQQAGKARFSKRANCKHDNYDGYISIVVVKQKINSERSAEQPPYEVLGKWALRGVVIGQAKKPGPMISICIINLSHAYNNWQLLRNLSDDYVFGQEHSNNTQDRQKVRKT